MPDFSRCKCRRHASGELRPDQAHDQLHLKLVTMPNICHGYVNGCTCHACGTRAKTHPGPQRAAARIRQPWEAQPSTAGTGNVEMKITIGGPT